jgi:hypothetical protein
VKSSMLFFDTLLSILLYYKSNIISLFNQLIFSDVQQ